MADPKFRPTFPIIPGTCSFYVVCVLNYGRILSILLESALEGRLCRDNILCDTLALSQTQSWLRSYYSATLI